MRVRKYESPVYIALETPLKEELKELAWQRRVSLSALVRKLIVAELAKEAKKPVNA